MSRPFGDRDVIKGKTIELVANSSMVLAHSSTSINFAVLFNKPIMIIKTLGIGKMGNWNLTDKFADSLGLKDINIDDDQVVNKLSFDFEKLPKDGFETYKYKYIMCKNVGNLTTWKIVIRSICK